MKKVLFIVAAVVCSVAARCPSSDTNSAELWPRPAEPRLTGASEWRPCRAVVRPGRVVAEADCGPAPVPPVACDEIVETHERAVQMLLRPDCTDAAIAALERFARVDGGALSDLVAAFYVRAQREDDPGDFLRAMDAAGSALAPAPAALFNQALVQQRLGLTEDAIRSWDAYLRHAEGEWADEARGHRNELARELARDASAQWQRNRKRLPAALRRADEREIARLIAPFPATAQRYFEDELLPQWAYAPSGQNLAAARAFANALSRRFRGDPYALHAVQAIAEASPAQLRALKEGHLAFREARAIERTFNRAGATAIYERAARLLDEGQSPLALTAKLARSVAHFEAFQDAAGWALLEEVQRRAAPYLHLSARIQATRANFLAWQSQYAESVSTYHNALAAYARLADLESVAATRARTAGVLRVLGLNDAAWREAYQAVRSLPRLADLHDRHVVLGETGSAARTTHPRIAFLYQNAIVELVQRELVHTPPECNDAVLRLRQNLSIALRERADIELDLGRTEPARRDLKEAERIAADARKDERDRRRLLARIRAVEGRALLRDNPAAAVQAFTAALGLSDAGFRNFRTLMFIERAGALRRAGRAAEAATDLAAALNELRAEESKILATRQRGQHEEVWNAYFSRFREAYDLVIAQYAESGNDAAAFAYAERGRAFEPLNLILQRDDVPRAFRELASLPMPDPARLRRFLPPGTFLLEYAVLPGRTYVWIVSRDSFKRLTLRARRADVERWTADLQRGVRQQNALAIARNIDVAYAELVRDVLATVETLPHGRGPRRRLVFVPDGAMHGLPFSALRDPATKRHLLEQAVVATDGSALLYVYSLLRDARFAADANPSILLVGNPSFDPAAPPARGLRVLPGAASEVARIAADYGARSEVRIGDEATVAEFLRLVPASTLVHFAGHSVTNVQTPSRSVLLFAPDAKRRGDVDARELLRELDASRTRLVVLSSCSSAGGLPVGPEGVAPLVRPFRGAGVPAVVGSLWDVPDATAERLLVSFHRHYRAGSDAATALQAAQLDLLGSDSAGLRSVLAWAPFQVIGHAASPHAARATTQHEKEQPP